MSRDKFLILQAEPDQLLELIAVLRRYADAAWPPGGSECAQASRDALLTTAEVLHKALSEAPGKLTYKRRQRSIFRAALEYHLGLAEFENRHALYEALLLQL